MARVGVSIDQQVAAALRQPNRRGALRRAMRLTASFPILPAAVLAIVVICAIFSPLLAPHPPEQQSLVNRLQPPFWLAGGDWSHPLGTDHLGRDMLSRLIYGSRVTVIVVGLTVTVSATIGTFVGMLAGYFGGWLDALLMRAVDFQIALPALLFGVMLATVLHPGLENVIFIIILFSWSSFARLVRAEVLTLRERDFVVLARVAGIGWARIFLRHLLPNVLNTVVVLATLEVSQVIVFEAALSFLGLGVVPPNVSWGQMLAGGREYIRVAWWLITMPGLAILAVALAGNLFGDWLRDRIDPHLARRG